MLRTATRACKLFPRCAAPRTSRCQEISQGFSSPSRILNAGGLAYSGIHVAREFSFRSSTRRIHAESAASPRIGRSGALAPRYIRDYVRERRPARNLVSLIILRRILAISAVSYLPVPPSFAQFFPLIPRLANKRRSFVSAEIQALLRNKYTRDGARAINEWSI